MNQPNPANIRQPRVYRRHPLLRDVLNPMDIYDDTELKKLFRFERHNLLIIIARLHPQLTHTTGNHGALTSLQQFLVTLRFYAVGSMQLSLGAWLHIDQSTVSRTVWKVTSAILAAYPNPFTSPPSTAPDFENNFNVPLNCFGLIDCTHIRILRPHKADFPLAYINRKKYFSLNVQLVCDSWGTVTNLVVQWPGSVHDSRIFKNSPLYNELSSGTLGGYLIADSGYALAPFCLTPYLDPVGDVQKNYNVVHKHTRSLVERTIGQAKKRFYCMGSIIRLKQDRIPSVVVACFILHNEAKRLYDPPIPYTRDEEDGFLDRNTPPPAPGNLQASSDARIRRLGEARRTDVANILYRRA